MGFSRVGPEFWRAYYQPVRDRIDQARETQSARELVLSDGIRYVVAYDQVWDVTIGMPAILLEDDVLSLDDLRRQCESVHPGLTEPEEHADFKRVLSNRTVSDNDGARWSIGSDGIIMRLGSRWDPSLMQSNPERRTG